MYVKNITLIDVSKNTSYTQLTQTELHVINDWAAFYSLYRDENKITLAIIFEAVVFN